MILGKKIDPKKDPRDKIVVEKEGIKTCCKCHKVLDVFPVTSTFYFHPHEGYYCGNCNEKRGCKIKD